MSTEIEAIIKNLPSKKEREKKNLGPVDFTTKFYKMFKELIPTETVPKNETKVTLLNVF